MISNLNNKQKSIIKVFTLLFVIVFGLLSLLKQSSWRIAFEEQPYLRCLPYEFSLIQITKLKVNDIHHGKLIVVDTTDFAKFYGENVDLLKMVVGLPGDTVNMTNFELRINNELMGMLKPSDVDLYKPYSNSTFVLQDNEYFVMGTTPVSLDSRIIGPITLNQMKGQAYAIL
jgi:signal peptidase I